MSRPAFSLLAVLALLSGGSVAAAELAPRPVARPSPAPLTAAVVGATRICPDLRSVPGGPQTRVSAGVAVAAAGLSGRGRIQVQPLTGTAAAAPVPLEHPGEVVTGLGAAVNGDALEVSADGALAAGLEVEQVTRSEHGESRGLAGLRCEPPRTEAWFVGGSTLVGDSVTLVLVNPDDSPALVDVVVWSSSGPADPRPGRGIVVPARSRAAVALDSLAPDREFLAVHVLVQRGRVAAALRDARLLGGIAKGVDWVPQAQPPATTVVVPGLPQGPGRRILSVTNPGTEPTVVSLQLTTPAGQFVPTGLDHLSVPAGTTLATELAPLTNSSAATVKVVSTGAPVLAGAFVYDGQKGPVRDLAYAGSALPLSGPALLTDLVIDRPTESTLLLTALGAAAAVEVTPVRVLGVVGPLPAPKRVAVPAGRTTALRLSTFLPAGATGRLAVEVSPEPGSGPVYAARYLREYRADGPLTTMLDLVGAAQDVPVPSVVRDPLLAVTR